MRRRTNRLRTPAGFHDARPGRAARGKTPENPGNSCAVDGKPSSVSRVTTALSCASRAVAALQSDTPRNDMLSIRRADVSANKNHKHAGKRDRSVRHAWSRATFPDAQERRRSGRGAKQRRGWQWSTRGTTGSAGARRSASSRIPTEVVQQRGGQSDEDQIQVPHWRGWRAKSVTRPTRHAFLRSNPVLRT